MLGSSTRISTTPAETPRVLVTRRDNIGDLICTLPLFEGLRRQFPKAFIGALVNSYNAPLLKNNPFLDDVHVYTKSKHRPGSGAVFLARDRLGLLAGLRKNHYNLALHAGSRPRQEIRVMSRLAGIKNQVQDNNDRRSLHEVERVYGLLQAMGVTGPPPAPQLFLTESLVVEARSLLAHQGFANAIGLHISAREDENRWPLENFATLIKKGAERGLRFVVFWSPGSPNRPEHPGDDERARDLLARCSGLPVRAYPTASLSELQIGLAAMNLLIGSDGGHVHIAAAAGTRVIGLYCEHKVVQWRPWGPTHAVLRGSRVADISVDAVIATLVRSTA